uniref:GST N-terminal domain-containing protein n=1 Tax=Bos indicus x Bos taurus TaxID=30522 RepID=A0A4W2EFC2_BOBOX
MDLELFLDLYLPPYHAIYIFTRKNGIPFELRPLELGAPGGQTLEHLNPEFLKVNPAGKVPALRDGDFLLNCRPTPVWMSAWPGSTRPPKYCQHLCGLAVSNLPEME